MKKLHERTADACDKVVEETMKIQLLAIDMDGTALNHRNTLSSRNQEALQAAVDSGVYVVPATGRQFSGLPPELEKVHGIRYYLCSNGAVVYDRMENRILHQDLMSCELALRTMRKICEYSSASSDIYINGKAFTSTERYAFPKKFGVDKLHEKTFLASRTPEADLVEFLSKSQFRPEKIFTIFQDSSECNRCWQELCTWPEIALTTSIENALEVTNHTATKGGGLRALAKILGIAAKSVMAVGDGLNDISMLDWAGASVAMGNANETVRSHARFLTADCDADGLALAIDRLILPSERKIY